LSLLSYYLINLKVKEILGFRFSNLSRIKLTFGPEVVSKTTTGNVLTKNIGNAYLLPIDRVNARVGVGILD
jgi:hypothetical protein